MEPTPAPAPAPKPRAEVTWCAWHLSEPARLACADCGTPICADCAARLEERAETADAVVCPPCAPRYVVRPSVPWDDPAEPYGRAWWHTITKLVAHPERFFSAFPSQGVGRALGFAFLTQAPIALVGLACALGQTWGTASFVEWLETVPTDAGAGWSQYQFTLAQSVGWFLLLPLVVAVLAVVVFFPVKLLGGRGSYSQAYRVVCYLTPLNAVAAIPCAGLPAFGGWWIYLVFLAGRRVFGLPTWRAAAVALVPVLAGCGCICASVGAGLGVAALVGARAAVVPTGTPPPPAVAPADPGSDRVPGGG